MRFSQVDVFGSVPLGGNPLAVVHDASALSTEQMQRFANWTGLSETTFLLPPTVTGADYRVRIFTTTRELPFAGHPTLGSAHVWLHAGGEPHTVGTIVQQCGAGLITIKQGDRLAFAAPPMTRFEPVDEQLIARIAAAFGIERADVLDSSWLVNGPEWIGLRLASAEQVLALQLDQSPVAGLDIGVIGPHEPGHDAAFEVRAFIPGGDVAEDPVTGSLNAGLAQWLIGGGQAPARYIAAQGTVLGRSGRVYVERLGQSVWIGGHVTTVIDGSVDL